MKKVDLIDKTEALIIELEELELPDRVIIEIIEDMFYDLHYY